MPRKKAPRKSIKYLLPQQALEVAMRLVTENSDYKEKDVWKEKYLYLLDYITVRNFERKLKVKKEFVNIHQETMAKILSVNNQTMAQMLRQCVTAGILKKDGLMETALWYRKGKKKIFVKEGKSYGYQFNEFRNLVSYEKQNCLVNEKATKHLRKVNLELASYQKVLEQIRIDESGLEKVLNEIVEAKKEKQRNKELYAKYMDTKERNYRESKCIINNKENTHIPFDGNLVPEQTPLKAQKEHVRYIESDEDTVMRCRHSIEKINSGRILATRPIPGSRVYSEITHLKRELRKLIRLDGQPIVGIDIRNSQPLIASVIFNEYWKKKGYMPEDVKEYQTRCELGKFYDDFIDEIGIPKYLRPNFKEDFFAKVFFSKVVDTSSLLKVMFIQRYPNVWMALCDEKGGLYSQKFNQFSIKLQKVEAKIIYDTVNLSLLKQGINAFNIFDSIYVNKGADLKNLINLVEKEFNQYNLKPTVNKE